MSNGSILSVQVGKAGLRFGTQRECPPEERVFASKVSGADSFETALFPKPESCTSKSERTENLPVTLSPLEEISSYKSKRTLSVSPQPSDGNRDGSLGLSNKDVSTDHLSSEQDSSGSGTASPYFTFQPDNERIRFKF